MQAFERPKGDSSLNHVPYLRSESTTPLDENPEA